MHDAGWSAREYRRRYARARDNAVQSRRFTRVVGVDTRSDRNRPGAVRWRNFRKAARGGDARAWRRRSPWKIDSCRISAAISEQRRNLESRAKNARYTRTLTFILSLTGRGERSSIEAQTRASVPGRGGAGCI